MKQIVLSGMRPTGKLHIGHYHGAIVNWLKLMENHQCFFFVADWHALTTDYTDTSNLKNNIEDMAYDWMATGLDPERCTLFIQSRVKPHAELHLLLSMITPIAWLERNPAYKEQLQNADGRDLSNYGFLGYPVLQTADIIIYKANKVPIGEDQVPHLELSREIVRRFNNLYKNVFPEPQAMLTEAPRIPGTDGRKMSKSYNNAIFLSDEPDVVEQKIKPMMTDPARKTRKDPGEPTKCPVYYLHLIYSTKEIIKNVETGCRTAGIGCLDCKGWLIPRINNFLDPIREKRNALVKEGMVWDVLERGSKKANEVAQKTLEEVRNAMGLLK
ncbi:MAG TPA: tryptophan--tRNA ligase [bacterium]